jgi:hypothetical protein
VSDPSLILDLIDGAIEDYETSGDAMRWAPGSSQVPDETGIDPADVPLRLLLNPSPQLRERLEAYEINRLRRELAATVARPTLPRPREPVVDAPVRWPQVRALFVGGPWHCDLRRMRTPLPSVWNVPILQDLSVWTYDSFDLEPTAAAVDYASYQLRRVAQFRGIGYEPLQGKVYAAAGVENDELTEALVFARRHGWTLAPTT